MEPFVITFNSLESSILDVAALLYLPLNWYTETDTYKYLMTLARIFSNNTLLITVHMKVSKHL